MSQAQWIDSPGRLQEWVDRHAATAHAVGMDTEFVRESTYFPKLALIQVAVATEVALIDPLAFAPAAIAGWLGQATGAVLMHSASEDIEALRMLLPEGPPRIFDTQIAAAFAGLGAGVGYQKLVGALLAIDLPKDVTRSDWTRRPLSDAQHAYAVQDVVHLAPLHDWLAARLHARGYFDWFSEDCARLVRRAQSAADPQPQLGLRGAASWPREAIARLRALMLWREAAARRHDVPRGWLLRDEHCLDLALDPPADAATLEARTRGQRALRHTVRMDLWSHLQQRLEDDFVRATLRPDEPLKGARRHAFDAMRTRVDAEATRLDLPPGLLCPRRALERYISVREWPSELEGWRRSVLEAALAPLLD